MTVTYAQRPYTAYDDAVIRIFRHFGSRIDRASRGKEVAPHTVSVRCYAGSRLVARVHVNLHTAEFVIYEVGA